ncbi:MAG: heme ABC exporter ATP-binding protein CcmA [Rhodobacteraceae bacterium]|nr:heme ABC exporter ATP-binding protein CcmA [Paracoccaceae bacterium]MCY4140598.1 heme ABC exporter ATP-binding protein CcmA [Paracoccaceae bacterium]
MDLEVTDLACRYGSRLIFSGVGFRVGPGGLLVVHGPNGSGKTTLLRCLAGLARPASGTIRIDSDQSTFLGHRSAVTATMSVADNLRFWANVHGYFGKDADVRTQKAAELLNITPYIDQPAGSLSAGQRRRLGIARIHAAGRAVWLLDEPTTALDADSITGFGTLLEDHLEAGGQAVLTSQKPEFSDSAASIDLAVHSGMAEGKTDGESIYSGVSAGPTRETRSRPEFA